MKRTFRMVESALKIYDLLSIQNNYVSLFLAVKETKKPYNTDTSMKWTSLQ